MLHDFSRLPDKTYVLRLKTLEAGVRASCSLCTFLQAQLQPAILDFQSHPDDIYVRLQYHPHESRGRDGRASIEAGLALSELELYLADQQFQTKIERRSEGCFLGLATNTGEAIPRP